MTDAMTEIEEAALAVMRAAEEIGLDPIAELAEDGQPRSVDVRAMRDGRVAAAVRLILRDDAWWAEHPARPRGRTAHSLPTRRLFRAGEDTDPQQLRKLDYWLSRVPGSGRTSRRTSAPGRDPMAWTRAGSWEKRGLGRATTSR